MAAICQFHKSDSESLLIVVTRSKTLCPVADSPAWTTPAPSTFPGGVDTMTCVVGADSPRGAPSSGKRGYPGDYERSGQAEALDRDYKE